MRRGTNREDTRHGCRRHATEEPLIQQRSLSRSPSPPASAPSHDAPPFRHGRVLDQLAPSSSASCSNALCTSRMIDKISCEAKLLLQLPLMHPASPASSTQPRANALREGPGGARRNHKTRHDRTSRSPKKHMRAQIEDEAEGRRMSHSRWWGALNCGWQVVSAN